MKSALIIVVLIWNLIVVPVTAGDSVGALLQQHRRSVAVVQGAEGGGSAFIAQIGKGKYLITNQHVVAGIVNPTFTMPDRTVLKVGTAAAAIDHDIMSFGIGNDVTAMEAMQGVDQFAAVGDDVVVLGNPDAAGVIRPITGVIQGIGPQLVEVSAQFIPGNSGSPIVHVKTGKVIAVATYLRREAANPMEGREAATVRRFGYRLDSIKRWEPVIWWQYHDEHKTLENVRQRTVELMTVLVSIRGGQTPPASSVTDPMLQMPLSKFSMSLRLSKDRKQYLEEATTFMNGLVRAANEDIALARQRIGYSYFRSELEKEEKMRAPVGNFLDDIMKARPEL